MPTTITMDVRQRTRDWVKRDRSNSRESATNEGPIEIVHLGGFRVGEQSPAKYAAKSRLPESTRDDIDRPVTRFFWPLMEEDQPSKEGVPMSELASRPQLLSHSTSTSKGAPRAPPTLKRSQSEAQIPRSRSKWKELPARPAELLSPVSLDEVIHVAHAMSPTPKTTLPQATAAPTGPLPPAPGPLRPLESLGAAVRLAVHNEEAIVSPTASSGRSSGRDSGRSDSLLRRQTPRHSAKERVWLHRNYKGEAPFLAAWGLEIQSEEDRAEGLQILKELMQAEMQAEETRLRKEEEAGSDTQNLAGRPRQESGASVTEAYLDDRLSRLDRLHASPLLR